MEDHDIIAQIKEYSDQPETLESIAAGLAKLNDPTRVEVIKKTREWIGDANASLRQRAQLLDLTRQMTRVHNNLRRVGR